MIVRILNGYLDGLIEARSIHETDQFLLIGDDDLDLVADGVDERRMVSFDAHIVR